MDRGVVFLRGQPLFLCIWFGSKHIFGHQIILSVMKSWVLRPSASASSALLELVIWTDDTHFLCTKGKMGRENKQKSQHIGGTKRRQVTAAYSELEASSSRSISLCIKLFRGKTLLFNLAGPQYRDSGSLHKENNTETELNSALHRHDHFMTRCAITTFVFTLTPACSVQLYWMSWDRSLTPSERARVLLKRFLGFGNSFRRSGFVLAKQKNKNVGHTIRVKPCFIPTLTLCKL